jgi:hypothetical protein
MAVKFSSVVQNSNVDVVQLARENEPHDPLSKHNALFSNSLAMLSWDSEHIAIRMNMQIRALRCISICRAGDVIDREGDKQRNKIGYAQLRHIQLLHGFGLTLMIA